MYTKQLAQFAHALTYEDLSPQAAALGRLCVEDLIGVALAGSASPQAKIWHDYFASGAQPEQAAAWTPQFPRIAYPQAAALNAAYGHLLDLDDVHNGSIVHLGVVTIPAAIAVGSAFHCSGRAVLAAVAAGYEVGARAGEAVNPESYRFWHTTGVVGALATAAAAELMAERQVRPEDVVQITDRTYAAAKQVADNPRPATLYAYKFSAQYVYLQAAPGCAAKLAQGVEGIEDVTWLDLGMPEAIWDLRAREFGPLVVGMDAHGDSIYASLRKAALEQIAARYPA